MSYLCRNLENAGGFTYFQAADPPHHAAARSAESRLNHSLPVFREPENPLSQF